ncbi:MAG: hypothetical protein JO321_12090 [Solirubrobacterales bacterium]|nr:hypothetical protein [Solirubrobacterales bacterium]
MRKSETPALGRTPALVQIADGRLPKLFAIQVKSSMQFSHGRFLKSEVEPV